MYIEFAGQQAKPKPVEPDAGYPLGQVQLTVSPYGVVLLLIVKD